MSLFQCEHCGCCENTALTPCALPFLADCFDWSEMPERRGQRLCSACAPTRHSDGTPVREAGTWHGQFARRFLPKGEFHTNRAGNLEHTATGSEDFWKFQIP